MRALQIQDDVEAGHAEPYAGGTRRVQVSVARGHFSVCTKIVTKWMLQIFFNFMQHSA